MLHIISIAILVTLVVSAFTLGAYYGNPFADEQTWLTTETLPQVTLHHNDTTFEMPSDWVEPLLVTITWTPSNPVNLVNTGEVYGDQAKYECVNNNLSINFITEYKVLRNNSHYIVSDRGAPAGYMVDLHPTDEVMYCTGWTNDYK